MGNPNAITGHSLDWQRAYTASAPQDQAQSELIAQLGLPMGASQTRDQAKRVDALAAQFSLMDPTRARRLYARLSNRGDALGQLFELTLHPLTQTSLLGLLRATGNGHDRGTGPTARGTDNRQPPPPRKSLIPPPVVPQPPSPIPTPPQPRSPIPMPPQPGPQGPRIIDPPDPDSRSWIWGPLTRVAGLLGVTLSAGLRILNPALLEAAADAAWLVFQTEEGSLTALYGRAGEAAAEAILPAVLGVNPALVKNLNDYVANIPVVDIATPFGLPSVKVRGVASALQGSALDSYLRSAYTSVLYDLIVGGPRADAALQKAANILLKIRPQLGPSWPADLKDLTPDGVVKYLREETPVLIPDNHVDLMRRTRGEDLYRRISNNPRLKYQFGIKDNGVDMANFINRQIDRFGSLHVTSEDIEAIAKLAAGHMPPEQNPRLNLELERLRRRRQRRFKLGD
jgi:hypothetical protein